MAEAVLAEVVVEEAVEVEVSNDAAISSAGSSRYAGARRFVY